ncbi:MAG: putative lipoprotein [Verrucomicrobia bacterium]|nr:putative lipoprotein [Verrucomicrobiota bacterium]
MIGERRTLVPAMKTSRLFLFAAIVVAAAFFSGCAAVKVQPWERATLASYSMRPDRDPIAVAMGEHTYFSREAANGGRGVGGSGCGCN